MQSEKCKIKNYNLVNLSLNQTISLAMRHPQTTSGPTWTKLPIFDQLNKVQQTVLRKIHQYKVHG